MIPSGPMLQHSAVKINSVDSSMRQALGADGIWLMVFSNENSQFVSKILPMSDLAAGFFVRIIGSCYK
ncbi:MAG: hypothetical protein K8R40_01860 [Anaerolineaceae bacterium]|nr:hypothetical protein [Anaerolineaceae bacterium]